MRHVTEWEAAEFKLTVALHALVDEAVQQRAAVVTEGGAPVAVDLKLVLCSGILQESEKKKILTTCQLVRVYMHDVLWECDEMAVRWNQVRPFSSYVLYRLKLKLDLRCNNNNNNKHPAD